MKLAGHLFGKSCSLGYIWFRGRNICLDCTSSLLLLIYFKFGFCTTSQTEGVIGAVKLV